ncbi:energy transducer TonB [Sphingomonas morindae]|uniref:Energy transducer TonB n=1 Tax=Sphingomonas morindae TaxID=1541170 RepID=A0ABY4XCK8_9SPHN|nr:energy transducer TonB [Sphingomonas morindae]
MPPALRASGEGGRVGVRYRVETDGRVSGCTITEPSGRPDLDALTCQLITERFRFRPSRTADGTPVRAIIVERHEWVVEHDPDEADDPR